MAIKISKAVIFKLVTYKETIFRPKVEEVNLHLKQEEISMTRMTGNTVDKTALQNHNAIKDELKKTETKRRMSRMAGINLTME